MLQNHNTHLHTPICTNTGQPFKGKQSTLTSYTLSARDTPATTRHCSRFIHYYHTTQLFQILFTHTAAGCCHSQLRRRYEARQQAPIRQPQIYLQNSYLTISPHLLSQTQKCWNRTPQRLEEDSGPDSDWKQKYALSEYKICSSSSQANQEKRWRTIA